MLKSHCKCITNIYCSKVCSREHNLQGRRNAMSLMSTMYRYNESTAGANASVEALKLYDNYVVL